MNRPSLIRVWRLLAWASLAFVVFWGVGMMWIGQSALVMAAAMYAPKTWAAGWLALLSLPGWRWGKGLSFVLLVGALFWAWPMTGWQMRTASGQTDVIRSRKILRVLTCNRGDHHGHSLANFVAARRPDVVALQDALFAHAYRSSASEWAGLKHGTQLGQFVLRSRYPIVKQEMLLADIRTPELGAIMYDRPGARFEIDTGAGGHVVIYNIHLPSPRTNFARYLAWEPWLGAVPLAGTEARQVREQIQRYWVAQREAMRLFVKSIESETLPVIVLGDWNIPDAGPLYRELTASLQDAHRSAGFGYGFTFPGDVNSFLAGGQPWLRIDYALCSRDWEVRDCMVETEAGEAQHRAVSATFGLRR